MKPENLSSKNETYFAAANGYTGFRNYFDSLFCSEEYERIFILKGGPGTGKSSLMKKVFSHFQNSGFSSDRILCSSDTASLDGVIIRGESGKAAAILDGTAPHERDTKIPGLIDEIVNLGDMWSTSALLSNRSEILILNKEKKKHYERAYDFLSLAGEYKKRIDIIVKSLYLKNDFKTIQDLLSFNGRCDTKKRKKIKLHSAFNKDGYTILPKEQFTKKKNISVDGIFGSEYVFMSRLKSFADRIGAQYTVFLSPFSENEIESISFDEENLFVSVGKDFDNLISTTDFFINSLDEKDANLLEYYKSKSEEMIEKSKDEFKAASVSHFNLEKIYSPSMNFSKIDSLTEKIIADISVLI